MCLNSGLINRSGDVHMSFLRLYSLCAVTSVFAAAAFVGGCLSEATSKTAAPLPTPPSMANLAPASQSASRTIEDGGTGPYKAVAIGDATLPTHTIFRPKDLKPFGGSKKLPIMTWGNGACANTPNEHQNFLSEIASHGYFIIAIGPAQAAGRVQADDHGLVFVRDLDGCGLDIGQIDIDPLLQQRRRDHEDNEQHEHDVDIGHDIDLAHESASASELCHEINPPS